MVTSYIMQVSTVSILFCINISEHTSNRVHNSFRRGRYWFISRRSYCCHLHVFFKHVVTHKNNILTHRFVTIHFFKLFIHLSQPASFLKNNISPHIAVLLSLKCCFVWLAPLFTELHRTKNEQHKIWRTITYL